MKIKERTDLHRSRSLFNQNSEGLQSLSGVETVHPGEGDLGLSRAEKKTLGWKIPYAHVFPWSIQVVNACGRKQGWSGPSWILIACRSYYQHASLLARTFSVLRRFLGY